MPNRTTPVNRNNLFYSEADFQLESNLMMQYMEEDLNQTVVVYEVDRIRTDADSIYQDSKDIIRYKTPKEIPCIYVVDESQMKSYDTKSSNGAYALSGNLTVYVMPQILRKYECDIKRGDYIGLLIDDDRMVYFVVVDDGKVNTANKNVMGAYKPAYRVVKCTPTAEFDGK